MVLKQGCMVGDCMSLKLGCKSLERERMSVMQLEVDTMLKADYPSSKADYMRLEKRCKSSQGYMMVAQGCKSSEMAQRLANELEDCKMSKADHMSLSLEDYNSQK